MVKRFFAIALFGFVTWSAASESGVLAYRAQTSLENGKFAKANGQLERALLASRKEADLLAEARVLMGMAQIRTMSLDFDLADSLLALVRKEALDESSQVMLTRSKVALANAREDYSAGAKLCDGVDESVLKKMDEPLRGAFYSECAIAAAGARDADDADEYLKRVGKALDKEGGFYAYTAARVADLSKDGSADSLYQEASKKSIQANKSYMTATILYYRSLLKGVSEKEKADMKLRCKNAFELMGLPNNSKRCEE